MKIRRDIASRLKKSTLFKPELNTPFIQGYHEYITNTYMTGNTSTRFDVTYLIDTLTVMKDNGVNAVDIKMCSKAMRIEGYKTPSDKEGNSIVTALVMAVSKHNY